MLPTYSVPGWANECFLVVSYNSKASMSSDQNAVGRNYTRALHCGTALPGSIHLSDHKATDFCSVSASVRGKDAICARFGTGAKFPSYLCTGLGLKALPRFGEFCYYSCLLLLPGFASSIHATWGPPYSRALYITV